MCLDDTCFTGGGGSLQASSSSKGYASATKWELGALVILKRGWTSIAPGYLSAHAIPNPTSAKIEHSDFVHYYYAKETYPKQKTSMLL